MFVRSFFLRFLNSLDLRGLMVTYRGPGVTLFDTHRDLCLVLRELTKEQYRGVRDYIYELILQDSEDNWGYVSKSRDRMAVMMRIQRVLGHYGIFSAQVDEEESTFIKSLKEKYGFSIRQIAHIVGRSKSTIHAHL